MKKLEGKVAVITGGNSGIGLATAQRFVSEGAHVFITGRHQSELDAAVKQIDKELKQHKIRVNAISLGLIDTPMSSGADEQLKTSLVSGVPMGRMGSPDEIAKAVSFLASDDSSYITGIELFVDGGMAQI